MGARGKLQNLIWARWRLRPDGSVEVVGTYKAGSEYVQKRLSYDSLHEAETDLGSSFVDVVTRATNAGSSAGRWRP
jgi:hypothetical protein